MSDLILRIRYVFPNEHNEENMLKFQSINSQNNFVIITKSIDENIIFFCYIRNYKTVFAICCKINTSFLCTS